MTYEPEHATLADVQGAVNVTRIAESPTGAIVAEASAAGQVGLRIDATAMRWHPADLAAEILRVQADAQAKARSALKSTLDSYRSDARVAHALDSLRNADAEAPVAPRREPPAVEGEDSPMKSWLSDTR